MSTSTVYRMTKTTSSHQFEGATAIGHAAIDFVEATEKEKKELQGLNDRLSVYISRVKQLEEQNRSLVIELDKLRGSLGGEVGQVKYKFTDSITSVRRDIVESTASTIGVEVRSNRLRSDLADYRNRYEEARREVEREKTTWGSSISAAQAELDRNKSIYASILEEEKRLYVEQDKLYADLVHVKDELDGAIVDRMKLQNQEEALKQELEFLNRVHVQEISELRGLLAQAPADTREFFKNELAIAIREIKAEYDKIIQTTKIDLEHVFQSKVAAVEASVAHRGEIVVQRQEEIRKMSEAISSLRSKFSELESKNAQLEHEAGSLQMQLREDQRLYEEELAKRDSALRFMREDCQTLIAELQALLNTKQTLDTEIAIYRKLVESEEHRVGKLVVEKDVYESGEVATRSTFKRHAKGNISIVECEATGKYIILENTSSAVPEDVTAYTIRRVLDGQNAFTYIIPHGTVIRPLSHIKIYGRNAGGIHSPPDSIVMESNPSWGQGTEVQTFLFNGHGIEKASHIQRTESTR